MKYTIGGFQQSVIMELDLDLKDVQILGYLRDFIASNSMYSEVLDDEKYYWVDYTSLIEQLPVLRLDTIAVGRRFKKYESIGICKKYVKKKGGTYTFIAIGDNFKKLFDYSENKVPEGKKPPYKKLKPLSQKVQCNENHCTKKYSTTVLKSTVPLYSKVQPKDSSSKYSSSKYSKRERGDKNTDEKYFSLIDEVIVYLNLKTKGNFTTKNSNTQKRLIKLIKNGYKLEDFKIVIDKKVLEWTGVPHMEPQINPAVLFGDKFETYLEQKVNPPVLKKQNTNSGTKFNNFKGREYDYVALENKLLGYDNE